MILGLRTCIYNVDDLGKAKEWYTRAFGVAPYFDEPYYVGFNIGGYELGLMPDPTPATEKKESVSTYWGVEDFARFLELGAKAHEEPENVGGPVVVATVKDPWGNVVGLIYNPEFKPEV